MSVNIKKLLLCVAVSILLCVAHVRGSTPMILLCLAGFMVLVAQSCVVDFTLPVLMFFLPWSPILRTDPDSFSFYTFALIMVCAISVIKKRFAFKRYHIIIGFLLLALTLTSKLIDGIGITFDYVAFMMLLFVFPVVKEEWSASKYNFTTLVVYFSLGIIVAALSAMSLSTSANIAKFITVDAYLTIVRRCGFYGDANFYTAQITAALGGAMMDLLQEKKRSQTVIEFVLILFLIYCGFLSGSKSYVLITAVLLVLWFIALFRMRGRTGFKLLLVFAAVLTVIFVATSTLFQDLLDVMETRFSFRSNLSDFTTGRTDLWEVYTEELVNDWKTLLLGKGYTNTIIGEKSTHNTLLQMVFQLGFLGMPLLIGWMGFFFADAPPKGSDRKKQIVNTLLLTVGAFAPWLAIDALFFDEFFLLQMYVYLGCRRLTGQTQPVAAHITDAEPEISSAKPELLRDGG